MSLQLHAVTVASLLVIATTIYFLQKRRKYLQLVALEDETAKYPFPLIQKTEISHDTRIFRFGLPTADHTLGLPIGQHVNIVEKVNGKLVIRSYTPVSSAKEKGYFDLMIKVYFPCALFPEGGKMSQFLNNLEIGQTVNFRGPTGHVVYSGLGQFAVRHNKKTPPVLKGFKNLSMISGGTGITPMLRIIRSIVENKNDDTKIRLLYANKTENDILCRNIFDKLSEEHPEKFKIWYTLGTIPENWQFSKGRVNKQQFQEHLFPAGPETAALICGPPAMVSDSCLPNLKELGYGEANIIVF